MTRIWQTFKGNLRTLAKIGAIVPKKTLYTFAFGITIVLIQHDHRVRESRKVKFEKRKNA